MNKKFINGYNSFCKSLNVLSNSCNADPNAAFVLGATAQAFNLTFDISWKVMKDIIVEYYAISNFVSGSPREVLQQAFSVGLIDTDVWLKMLRVRNTLAHDYDGEIAMEWFVIITTTFYNLFTELRDRVDKLLSESTTRDMDTF